MIRENDIERYMIKKMKDIDALCFKWTAIGTRAVPDRIVVYHGSVYFVELKAPGKSPRADQKRMFERIEKHGVKVTVISEKFEVDQFIDYMDFGHFYNYES